MKGQEHLRDILENTPRYKIPERDPMCDYAQAFAGWIDEWLFPKILIDVKGGKEGYARTNYALALLAKECVAFINEVPRSHSLPWTDRGHKCIPLVFVETVKRIVEIERELDPLPLFEPPPPVQVVDLDGTLTAIEEAVYGKHKQETGQLGS